MILTISCIIWWYIVSISLAKISIQNLDIAILFNQATISLFIRSLVYLPNRKYATHRRWILINHHCQLGKVTTTMLLGYQIGWKYWRYAKYSLEHWDALRGKQSCLSWIISRTCQCLENPLHGECKYWVLFLTICYIGGPKEALITKWRLGMWTSEVE